MDETSTHATRRLGAYTAIAGSLCAITGAALFVASGADIDRALAIDDVAAYLTVAGGRTGLLVANLTIWMAMAFLFGIAATAMSALCRQHRLLASVAMYCYWTGVPLVLAAFTAWLAVVVRVAPDTSSAAILVTETVGWFASRADWIATILIVGIGPTLLAAAGRDDWVPKWLARWSVLTAIAAVLCAIAMFTGGAGLSTYGFLIVPVGVGWMIAAGVVLARGGGRGGGGGGGAASASMRTGTAQR
jgi:hypothetical protein